ncbi:MAG: iron ABC transporter permease [Marivivens sp.]|nr:iron ABC transporter permease [Marivivens sp.]
MKPSAIFLAFLLVVPTVAAPQGFAGMATAVEGFNDPRPAPAFSFPADHGAHPDYRIEWWYLTANLQDAAGTDYGLHWTLFRSALAPGDTGGWDSPQVWFAHAAVTTEDAHLTAERFARGGIGQAGVEIDPFAAWIDEWTLSGETLDALSLTASGDAFAYDITLNANGPLIFHGGGGYSVKSPEGQASYYYSQPSYEVTGTLTLPGGDVVVTGTAWLDREWSSNPLSADQQGWDWFSLSFDTGEKLMAAQLRSVDGSRFRSGTWIMPDGTTESLGDDALTLTPIASTQVAGRDLPVEWRIEIPSKSVDVSSRPLNAQAWMDASIPYWEGPVFVTGSHSGRGYLEMTGYEE